MSRLSYRLQELEERIASNDKEVGLSEILHWLYRMYGPRLELDEPLPLTPDEQREYEDYQRRSRTSKTALWLAGFSTAREVDQAAQAQKPASVDRLFELELPFAPHGPSTWMMEMDQAPAPPDASIPPAKPVHPDPPPAPVFEEHRSDELIKAVPGMRLDVLMALQRK